MNYSYEKITKISREFRDLAGDLLRSDIDTFQTNINFFRAFCDEEEILIEILKPIKEREYDTNQWYENALNQNSSFIGSGDATLPQNKLDALKVIYDMLWSENALNTLLNFGHATMFAQKYNDQLSKVNDKITNIFIRYIIRQLEEKVEMVKPQSGQSINNWYVNAPSNIATQSSDVHQQINIKNPEVQKAVEDLRITVEKSKLTSQEKDDALEIIDMIEDEVTKELPSKSKLQKIVSLLPAVDNLVSIGANLIGLFN
ncbi:hypothetical protein [Heyndrickxia ginsengihumi]|uniref:hypothetical protein n=1 Tax=Heyndrickxia ginsengihumi TaxID=363870 RepID=UPI0004726690|nr:hypothetical protein [Heyndrickxia ginsengihumi]